jgi:hypothetical protein
MTRRARADDGSARIWVRVARRQPPARRAVLSGAGGQVAACGARGQRARRSRQRRRARKMRRRTESLSASSWRRSASVHVYTYLRRAVSACVSSRRESDVRRVLLAERVELGVAERVWRVVVPRVGRLYRRTPEGCGACEWRHRRRWRGEQRHRCAARGGASLLLPEARVCAVRRVVRVVVVRAAAAGERRERAIVGVVHVAVRIDPRRRLPVRRGGGDGGGGGRVRERRRGVVRLEHARDVCGLGRGRRRAEAAEHGAMCSERGGGYRRPYTHRGCAGGGYVCAGHTKTGEHTAGECCQSSI